MATESIDDRFAELDLWPVSSVAAALLDGQVGAAMALRPLLPIIATAVDAAAARLRDSAGRLIYAGAGTSGRVAVQDGVELWPTFGWPQDRLILALAGGRDAMFASIEGAEDDSASGQRIIADNAVDEHDVVIGVAASGLTPYTVAALREARTRGAQTIGISSNADTPLLQESSHPICIDSGNEVIAGSTRMNAGTAQKIVLNMLSTGIMIELRRVYGGLMVSMQVSNRKLHARAVAIVERISGRDTAAAEQALAATAGDIKLAVLVALGSSRQEAEQVLHSEGGDLRQAIAGLSGRTTAPSR